MRKRSLLALAAAVIAVAVVAPSSAVGSSRGGITIVRVKSAPNGKVLSRNVLNTVAVHPRFAFLLGLRNDGETRELQVTLRLRNSHGASVYTERFLTFLPAKQHETVGVRVKQVLFAQRQSLEVRVSDVPHKRSWTAKFPVIFALG